MMMKDLKDRCAFSYDFEFHNKKRAFRAYVNNIHPDQTAMQNMPKLVGAFANIDYKDDSIWGILFNNFQWFF